MKQIDKHKYLALAFFIIALGAMYFDQRIIAGVFSVIGMVMLMFNSHKSGNLFIWVFSMGILTLGFVNDYPFSGLPATLICVIAIGIAFNLRTFFYNKLFIYKVLWIESFLSILIACVFVVLGIVAHYTWLQWLIATPIYLFGFFSYIIYKDRNEAREMVQSKNLEIKIGTKAPDFTLPDQNGKNVNLKELLVKNHVLLIFVRGDWCPTCHMMLRSYFKNKDKFAEKNVRIVGIGPDPQGVNKEIMQRIDESSVLLSDEEQNTALLYTSQLQTNNPISEKVIKKGIPLPASFLVHQNGSIAFTSRSDKAGEILQPDLIFNVIETFK